MELRVAVALPLTNAMEIVALHCPKPSRLKLKLGNGFGVCNVKSAKALIGMVAFCCDCTQRQHGQVEVTWRRISQEVARAESRNVYARGLSDLLPLHHPRWTNPGPEPAQYSSCRRMTTIPSSRLGRRGPLSAAFAAAMIKLSLTVTNAPSVGHVLSGVETSGDTVPTAL